MQIFSYSKKMSRIIKSSMFEKTFNIKSQLLEHGGYGVHQPSHQQFQVQLLAMQGILKVLWKNQKDTFSERMRLTCKLSITETLRRNLLFVLHYKKNNCTQLLLFLRFAFLSPTPLPQPNNCSFCA